MLTQACTPARRAGPGGPGWDRIPILSGGRADRPPERLPGPVPRTPELVTAPAASPRNWPATGSRRPDCRPPRTGQDAPGRPALAARAAMLLAEHGDAWRGPLPALAKGAVEFRRGFVESLQLPAAVFLEQAEAVFAAAPLLRRLDLHKAG